jgi:hypothetical protein
VGRIERRAGLETAAGEPREPRPSASTAEAPADPAPPRTAVGGLDYLFAALIPLWGLFIAIGLFARDKVGPGLAILLVSVIAAAVWFAVIVSLAG